MSTKRESFEGQTGFGRGVRGPGSSPGNLKKPVLQMVQSEVFLSYISSTVLNVVFECDTWEGCDVRSRMRTSFPLLSHRLLHFVHGRHRLLDHPSFVEPLTLRQLSVAGSAGTLLVPANIRATSTRYRKVRRTQITLRHAIVRQSCLTISDMAQDSLNLYFLFGAIFFNRGSDLRLRHLISREYGKQSARASYPKNAGDYPMRIHHPRHSREQC